MFNLFKLGVILKNLILSLAVILFSLHNVHASSEFKNLYTTKSGLEWSQTIGQFRNACGADYDMYKNICPDTPPTFPIPAPQAYPFYNSSLYSNFDSLALRACNAIGGRLPTFWEFQNLIEEFEHVKQAHNPYSGGVEYLAKFPLLTEKGASDLRSVFTDTIVTPDNQQYYWTGSSRDYAFGIDVAVLISFQGENLKMLREQPRHYKYSVRCVR